MTSDQVAFTRDLAGRMSQATREAQLGTQIIPREQPPCVYCPAEDRRSVSAAIRRNEHRRKSQAQPGTAKFHVPA